MPTDAVVKKMKRVGTQLWTRRVQCGMEILYHEERSTQQMVWTKPDFIEVRMDAEVSMYILISE
jgi:coenzyme PQQ precursor peptide PqqA